MNRRDFMKGILAAGMAPAIVKAENIMRINPRGLIVQERKLIIPPGVDAAEVARLFIHANDGRILSQVPMQYAGAPYRDESNFLRAMKQPLRAMGDMVAQSSGHADHMVLEMPDPLNPSIRRRYKQAIASHGFNLSSRQLVPGMDIKFTEICMVLHNG